MKSLLICPLLLCSVMSYAKDTFQCEYSKDPSKSKWLIVWTNNCTYQGKQATLEQAFSAYVRGNQWLGGKNNLAYRLFPKTLPKSNSQSVHKIEGESYVFRSKWTGKNRVSVGLYNTSSQELVSVLHLSKQGSKIKLLQESTEE